MKITKKRIAIATAAAALVTAGIFGGTYAKYQTEAPSQTDNARLAKFYLQSDNTPNLFDTEYNNYGGTTGTDVKNNTGDGLKLIAPNVTTTNCLYFTVETEVKSKLTFSGLEIDTNLPEVLWDDIKVFLYPGTYTVAELAVKPDLVAYDVPGVVQAGTTAGTSESVREVPVGFQWDLDNGIDDEETEAAIKQYEEILNGGVKYYLNLTGQATLTQID